VILESAGARYLRPYGAVEDPMPHLTRLAREAVLFENAYAVYPESIKGLFSVLCSVYPAVDTEPRTYEGVNYPSIASVLAGAGYRTALFHSGRFMYLGMNAIIRNRGFHTLEDAGDIGGEHDSSFGIDEPSAVRRILTWIDAIPADQPFFVTYLPIAGHHPYESSGEGPFPEHDEAGRYRNALFDADAALGTLLEGLAQRRRDRNTLFVIFGDHGEAFGQHEGNYGHTFLVYDENVRVPFILAAPGVCEARRVSRVASLIDIAPTILDLLGLPFPASYQGQSLLDARERMALFFTAYSLGFLGLRDREWKFIYELGAGRTKLFDLRLDPEERNDLSARFPDRIDPYTQRLLGWSAAQRELILRNKYR
jgi:arylsulfatase A-like enzyme